MKDNLDYELQIHMYERMQELQTKQIKNLIKYMQEAYEAYAGSEVNLSKAAAESSTAKYYQQVIKEMLEPIQKGMVSWGLENE